MKNLLSGIHSALLKQNKGIAVAESCTGGLLSEMLTRQSGSSVYFLAGIAAYSNTAKQSLLKIPAAMIRKHGAVSKKVAIAMAKNIRKIAKTDFGISITGIAGPSGGAATKPVGTVFIAVAAGNKTICKKFRFTGNRQSIRKKSAIKALELLRKLL